MRGPKASQKLPMASRANAVPVMLAMAAHDVPARVRFRSCRMTAAQN